MISHVTELNYFPLARLFLLRTPKEAELCDQCGLSVSHSSVCRIYFISFVLFIYYNLFIYFSANVMSRFH